MKLWELDIPKQDLTQLAFKLGADVPPCLNGFPIHVTGAGEIIERAPVLPDLAVCLVIPGVEMPTGPVFKAFDEANPHPTHPEIVPLDQSSYESLSDSLSATRNDLEPHACNIAPEINDAVAALGQTSGALIARMSGSGATVFALFASLKDAQAAEAAMKTRGWWAMAASLRTG